MSHSLTHSLIMNTGSAKKGAGPAFANYVIKLNDAGEVDASLFPSGTAKVIYLQYSRGGVTTDMYLKIGETYSNLAGSVLVKDASLVGISVVNSDVTATFTVEVRKNPTVVASASLSVVSSAGGLDAALSIPFLQGDEIAVFISGTATDPVVLLEFEQP